MQADHISIDISNSMPPTASANTENGTIARITLDNLDLSQGPRFFSFGPVTIGDFFSAQGFLAVTPGAAGSKIPSVTATVTFVFNPTVGPGQPPDLLVPLGPGTPPNVAPQPDVIFGEVGGQGRTAIVTGGAPPSSGTGPTDFNHITQGIGGVTFQTGWTFVYGA